MVRIRPEAEQKLRAGFQRRVDRQAERYAAQLTHAEQLAVRLECGEVAGVFSGQAGGGVRRRAYVVGLLPMAAIPVLIAGAAVGVPGMVPLLAASPSLSVPGSASPSGGGVNQNAGSGCTPSPRGARS